MPEKVREVRLPLPGIPSSNREKRKKWRSEILKRASEEAARVGLGHLDAGSGFKEKVEVFVVFHLREEESDESCWPDIDNLLKDVHDALQGALGSSAKGITKRESRDMRRIFRSDKQIYRVVAEKRHGVEDERCGGQLIIRPYVKREWRDTDEGQHAS
jgi:hypothetical protein